MLNESARAECTMCDTVHMQRAELAAFLGLALCLQGLLKAMCAFVLLAMQI